MVGSIKLTPEVIAAREFARIERESRPMSEVINDIKKEREARGIAFIKQMSQPKNKK